MGTIKDRNGMNLTEAEDIKKRWQQQSEKKKKFKKGKQLSDKALQIAKKRREAKGKGEKEKQSDL